MAPKYIYLIAGVLALGVAVLWATRDGETTTPTTTAPPSTATTASGADGGPTTAVDGSTEPVAPPASAKGSGGGAPDTPLTTTASVTPPPTTLPPQPTAKPTAQPTGAPPIEPTARPTAKPTATVEPPKPSPTSVAPADPGTADAVAEQVDVIYKPVTLFRARFKQKYVAKVAGKTKHSEGWAAVKRPRRISFKYKAPNKNRVVSDGKIIKIYEHDNQQMYVGNMAGTDYPGALAFIMGNGLRPNFTFKFHETAKWEGGPVLIGIPRVANPGYKTVLFYIDDALLKKGDPACVRRVLVLDAQGNRNRFDFLDVEQPADIPDSEFLFEPPKGTEILK